MMGAVNRNFSGKAGDYTPTRNPPWWSDLKSHVAETWKAALAAHKATLHSGTDIVTYTDGSLTEQRVEAAVVSSLGHQEVIQA